MLFGFCSNNKHGIRIVELSLGVGVNLSWQVR